MLEAVRDDEAGRRVLAWRHVCNTWPDKLRYWVVLICMFLKIQRK